jgi:hypothetical protein
MLIKLDGEWAFTYTPTLENRDAPTPPEAVSFTTSMPVPGIWDDHLNRITGEPWYFYAQHAVSTPMHHPLPTRDATLPYLIGVGWYRRTIDVPANWQGCQVTLECEGARLEAWAWLNGHVIGYHEGHSTPFTLECTKALQPGQPNDLLIAVANTRTDRSGCDLRGYHGRCGGMSGSVALRVTGEARIASCFLYPDGDALHWEICTHGRQDAMTLAWSVTDPDTGECLGRRALPVHGGKTTWTTGTLGMRPWSPWEPKQYRVEVTLLRDGVVHDRRMQPFGLRALAAEGMDLRLNGRPIYLRGVTDHCYFPLTCTPPRDMETYRRIVHTLKDLGFNWIRCHTWTPNTAYLQAADELGMLMQVEPPVGCSPGEWQDIVRYCRTHPSVVIYCGGNEELLDEANIERFGRMAQTCKALAPEALFNPHEGLRGVEYGWDPSNLGDDVVHQPYPHNPRRLERLKKFADLFGQYSWGQLSYGGAYGDWRELDELLPVYERPCLTHELGIRGSYLSLDLEHRYAGTRIGAGLYAAVRAELQQQGLLDRAGIYYHNSCAWLSSLRKAVVEKARKCRLLAGYDLLGPIDQHWLMTGYPVGILNEFYEMKPGESRENVLRYNGESVVLLDHPYRRNLCMGESYAFPIMLSLWGAEGVRAGELHWQLTDRRNQTVLCRGTLPLADVPVGQVQTVGEITFTLPPVSAPAQATLRVQVTGNGYAVENAWDFWLFSPIPTVDGSALQADKMIGERFGAWLTDLQITAQPETGQVFIASALTPAVVDHLADGGRVLLLGDSGLPAVETMYQQAAAGRAQYHMASVIAQHPLMRRFPHAGYCDWQFYTLLEGGSAVDFSALGWPFAPIIEMVSSFKQVRKQANLFEVCVGAGRLLACTMHLDTEDPAGAFLLHEMIAYLSGTTLDPAPLITVRELRTALAEQRSRQQFVSDANRAVDPNAERLSAAGWDEDEAIPYAGDNTRGALVN